MQKASDVFESGARRRVDRLLRSVMMTLFGAGAVAICALWTFESKYGLIDDVARFAYPLMIAAFVGGAAMLYRWPHTIPIARWIGFCTMSIFLFLELMASLWTDGPLVGNYAFISLLMWLPLAYAIALFLLETRQAPWAASAMFAFIAVLSLVHIAHSESADASDTALLVNLLASHVVLLACLSGLVKIKLVLQRADLQSRRLFEQASTDPLTGLANRRYGQEMLKLAALEHSLEAPSAVMLCDVDCFKEINDQHGHDVGDKVVLAIASLLQDNTREVDTVVRWGGDEFLIVVPRIAASALREMAERLRARVSESVMVGDRGRIVSPTLSIGIAEMSDDESLNSWIKRADEALYLAKSGGRNRCAFAHPVNTQPELFTSEIGAEPVLDSE